MKLFTTMYAAMMFGSTTQGPCSVLVNAKAEDSRRLQGGLGIYECDGTRRGPASGPRRVGSLPAKYAR